MLGERVAPASPIAGERRAVDELVPGCAAGDAGERPTQAIKQHTLVLFTSASPRLCLALFEARRQAKAKAQESQSLQDRPGQFALLTWSNWPGNVSL